MHPDDETPLDRDIRVAIWNSCLGYNGDEPHAVTWSRGGYRNDVPTLCDRCRKLTTTIQDIVKEDTNV